jgi:transcriptional regulator GlxA family with amidase domain
VNSTKLFTRDESFYTCAGGAASLDLALALIEDDCGRKIALRVARELVVPSKRSAEDEQYSESLKFQIQSSGRFADLPGWIESHLNEDLSVDALAERACMSRRNFTRLFHNTFGKSPAQFVAEARIMEARRRVLIPRTNLDTVAASVGFKSPDVFSKSFERHVGVRPRTYRALCKASAKD